MSASSTPAPHAAPVGRYRWRILAMLFAATTINYMDRSILGVLGPTLQYKVFNWTDAQWANINICFKIAYSIGMLSMGAVIDRFGTKVGYTLSIIIWSAFGMLHAAVQPAWSFIGFCLARFGLGLGESGNFPAAIKTVAEWFPKKERAYATGIFNAGSNVGAIMAPLAIPLVVSPDGTNWQYAFFLTGIFSAVWVVIWMKMYKRPELHPSVSKEELAFINSDSVAESITGKLPWSKVFPVRETWAFALAKSTDAVWWFYLFWGGKFLYDRFGLDIKSLALPLIIIYVVADVGSIVGGWLSSFFIKKGWPVNRARKTTLFICALTILPVMFVTQIGTKFNADERFFQKLQTETYKVEEIITVDGKAKRVRHEENVSAANQAALRPLAGKTFESAKEFTAAAGELITMKEARRIESAIHNSARSDRFYWIAVLLISLAAAGHQAWSANLYTLISDVFPKKATASVAGIGGMVGGVSGIVADKMLGNALTASGAAGYFWAFLIAGSLYLVMLGVAHLLMPKMTPLDENLKRIE